MSDISVSVVITILAMIFSAGVTWGLLSARQRNSQMRLTETISELKEAVKELKTLATDFQVMKAINARSEQVIQSHAERLTALELAFAKLQRTP